MIRNDMFLNDMKLLSFLTNGHELDELFETDDAWHDRSAKARDHGGQHGRLRPGMDLRQESKQKSTNLSTNQ